jgi:putative thioredoxin
MTEITVTRANFERDVLQASRECPVLVDFWAAWCTPCRVLGPLLDRLAAEYAGRFTLAKINTEDDPDLAGRYGVRGIPNCKLFVDGEVIDEFTGALPESALREFLARALPSPAAPHVAAAKALLGAGNAVAALQELDAALTLDATDEDALLTRADALLVAGRAADARSLCEQLETGQYPGLHSVRDEHRLAAVKARAAFSDVADGSEDLATLARRAAATPVDCAAKLAYARALANAGDYEPALAELLAIVRTDRKFGDDAGRKTMLAVFAALPPDSELARRYRRELASALN